jgi:Carboxypeptidase regulatory-like domain/Domain of unknown function (DUF4397)
MRISPESAADSLRHRRRLTARAASRPLIVSWLVALLASACSDGSEMLPGPTPGPGPGPTVTGMVTNAGTGGPVAGAEVSIGAAKATTGPDGRFNLTGLTTGSATLRCTAPGFVEFETDVTVTSGSVTRDIELVGIYVGPGPNAEKARLRVLHTETAWPTMDVFLDGALVLNDLPSLTASDYLDVRAGRRRVTFRVIQGWEEINGNLVAGAAYTVIPCCTRFPSSYLLADDHSEPGTGNAKLRVIHLASETDLDVYVTAPGADLAAATPTFTVGTLWASDYLELPAGAYQVRATRFDNTIVLLDSGTLRLEAGQVRSAVAVDAP